MPDEPARRYSSEEFALILRHAAGLQDQGPARPGEDDGLTLEEIVAAAREVGLDPDTVARAAALVPEHAPPARSLLGEAETIQLEYRARGEITDADHADIVELVRRATQHQGRVTPSLGGIEWRPEGWITQLSVTVIPRDGHTSVRLLADRGAAALLTYAGCATAGLAVFGITGSLLEPSGVLAVGGLFTATVGTAMLTARMIYRLTTRTWRRSLTRLMSDLSALVERRTGAHDT